MTEPAASTPAPSRPVAWFCRVGPAGHVPVAPGTAGALAALPAAWAMSAWPWWAWTLVLVPLTALSVYAVGLYVTGRPDQDPKEVVVDEFVGCLVAAAFVPGTLAWQLAAFVAFRVLDIAKPWPVSWLDRRVKGGWGVVGDDVAAGLMAGALLWAIELAL